MFVQEEVQKWEILLCKSKHRVKLVLWLMHYIQNGKDLQSGLVG